MKILLVNSHDVGGGAEKITRDLFDGFRFLNHITWLALGRIININGIAIKIPRVNTTKNPFVARAENFQKKLIPYIGRRIGARKIYSLTDIFLRPSGFLNKIGGFEDFDYPGSKLLINLLPEKPDIINLHNLHSEYFDLRFLIKLSKSFPVVWTLHDEWGYTGHCAYSLDCEKWQNGCGNCPYLSSYPPLLRDGTSTNWNKKKGIYEKSHLYITTPSRWLFNNVELSMLKKTKSRVIPNGVDISIFQSSLSQYARKKLDLPEDAKILLFVAFKGGQNPYKDYSTIESALNRIAYSYKKKEIIFIALGGDYPSEEKIGSIKINHVGFQQDPLKVALYYQAADIYLHAALSENFPTTVLEALACGTPVIATAVGGIPEQISDGETGFLVPPSDSSAMADRIVQLLKDDELREKMGMNAANEAREKFDLNRQISEYLDWYLEIIDDWKGAKIS